MKAHLLAGLLVTGTVFGMAAAQGDQEEIASPQDVMIIFVIFIIAVASLYLYLARHSIFRTRTEYDKDEFDSKKNRDYEKYHSDWLNDYEEFGGDDEEQPAASGEQDHYKVLGVPPDASTNAIKARYRELAKTHHPDVAGGDSSPEMARINEAYETLADKQRRSKYDRRRAGRRRDEPPE